MNKSRDGVWAVVLSAGLSSRMQGFKPLLPLGGPPNEAGRATMLDHAIGLFRALGVNVLVVAGHRAAEVEAVAHTAGAATVRNPDFALGMLASVRAGAAALPADAESFFVLPVDIPLVRPLTPRLLLRAAREHPGLVLHPVFKGQRGHPPLLPGPLRADILAWDGPGGLAGLLETRPGVEVPVPDANILFDVDDEAALAEARERAARLDVPTRDECEALLAAPGLHPMTLPHSRAVARHALRMARAVNARGGALDPALVEAAALLHDIAKGLKDHERAGGELLRDLGFPRVADIVAVHLDMNPTPSGPVSEAEIVYLADKVARGASLVSVEERFQAKLDQYAHDPEAVAAIRGRRERALASRERIERAAGAPLSELLSEAAP